VATAKGRRVGRPVVVDAAKLAWAAHLRDTGHTVAEIVAKTGIARDQLVPALAAPTTRTGHRRRHRRRGRARRRRSRRA